MIFLLSLFFSVSARAQQMSVVDVQYRPPAKAVSCGLSRQRERERLKVMRELSELTRRPGAIGNGAPSPSDYAYALSKLLMPTEDRAELTTEVRVLARPPEGLLERVRTKGLARVFLVTRGPGFVWQSFADQLPPEMSIAVEGDNLVITYATYLSAVCERDLMPVSVEWIPSVEF